MSYDTATCTLVSSAAPYPRVLWFSFVMAHVWHSLCPVSAWTVPLADVFLAALL